MIEHLNNILKDIELLKNSNDYNLDNINIDNFESSINSLKEKIDLENVKIIAKIIYQLNIDNTFSILTDHISNEFYAFEFILEQRLRKKNYNF